MSGPLNQRQSQAGPEEVHTYEVAQLIVSPAGNPGLGM